MKKFILSLQLFVLCGSGTVFSMHKYSEKDSIESRKLVRSWEDVFQTLRELDSLTLKERIFLKDISSKAFVQTSKGLWNIFSSTRTTFGHDTLYKAFVSVLSQHQFSKISDELKALGLLEKESNSKIGPLLLEDVWGDSDISWLSDVSWLPDSPPCEQNGLQEEPLYGAILDPDAFLIEAESFQDHESLAEENNVESPIFNQESERKKHQDVLDCLKSGEVSHVYDIQGWMLQHKGLLVGEKYISSVLAREEFVKKSLEELKQAVIQSYQEFPGLTLEERVLEIRRKKILLSLNDIQEIKEALNHPEKWEVFKRNWNERSQKKMIDEKEEKRKEIAVAFFEKGEPLSEIRTLLRLAGFSVPHGYVKETLKDHVKEREERRKERTVELFKKYGPLHAKIMNILRLEGFVIGDTYVEKTLKDHVEELEKRKEERTVQLFKEYGPLFRKIENTLRKEGFIIREAYVEKTLKDHVEELEKRKEERTVQLFKEYGLSYKRIEKTLRDEKYIVPKNFAKETLKDHVKEWEERRKERTVELFKKYGLAYKRIEKTLRDEKYIAPKNFAQETLENYLEEELRNGHPGENAPQLPEKNPRSLDKKSKKIGKL